MNQKELRRLKKALPAKLKLALEVLIVIVMIIGAIAPIAANIPLFEQQVEQPYYGVSTAIDMPLEWSAETAPAFYADQGPSYGIPATWTEDTKDMQAFIATSPLDALGRAGTAYGIIDKALMDEGRARERADIQSLYPSGWSNNQEVNVQMPSGISYHGYFWNRSHLVAKSLGGPDTLDNLVTATRAQNVGDNSGEQGMAYAESMARSWLDANPTGRIFYSATPIYIGSEAVCRAVSIEMQSDDKTLDKSILVYNAMPGYEIDYQTGQWNATSE